MTAIARTDLPVAIEGDGVEFRTDRFGDQNIAWVRLPAGALARDAAGACANAGAGVTAMALATSRDGTENFISTQRSGCPI